MQSLHYSDGSVSESLLTARLQKYFSGDRDASRDNEDAYDKAFRVCAYEYVELPEEHPSHVDVDDARHERVRAHVQLHRAGARENDFQLCAAKDQQSSTMLLR